ncbi:MAG: orotidine-5'-phosphate decarboxylase [Rhizobiales bacterium]|nr:orotidine-5'-phosphate decarboxylase [Hyphomicrobiales bacterium]
MNNRLIVALDFPTVDEARDCVKEIGPACRFYKIGLELLFAGGQDLVKELLHKGHQIFVDAKLLDIGATVQKSTANIALMGADFLTLHVTDQKTLKAAVEGRGDSSLKLLGVTVLTNLEQDDLIEQGIEGCTPKELVLKRAKLAFDAGLDGVVASAQEAADIRKLVGPDFLIVTPGIRPSGAEAGDQARVATPKDAIGFGADYIVVGRPITKAEDPQAAAQAIQEEIGS